jgi:hypothetical protein
MAEQVSKSISSMRQVEYKRTYDKLMERASGRKYISGEHERHHIVPRSLGGSNAKTNIAVLTYREHFLAHWLLTKFTEGEARRNMHCALWRMMAKAKNNRARVYSSWEYEIARRSQSIALLGNTNAHGNRGRKQPKEQPLRAWDTRRANGLGQMKDSSKEKLRVKAFGRSKGSKSALAKPVVNLDTYAIFGVASEAAEFYGLKSARKIRTCCLGQIATYEGHRFAFLNSPEGYAASVAFLKRKRLVESFA